MYEPSRKGEIQMSQSICFDLARRDSVTLAQSYVPERINVSRSFSGFVDTKAKAQQRTKTDNTQLFSRMLSHCFFHSLAAVQLCIHQSLADRVLSALEDLR